MGYLKVAVQDLHSNFISECQSTIVRVVTYIIAPIIAPTHNHYYLLQNHFISMIAKLTAGHATYSELFGHIEIVLISQPRYTRNANDENRHYLHTKRHEENKHWNWEGIKTQGLEGFRKWSQQSLQSRRMKPIHQSHSRKDELSSCIITNADKHRK